MIQTLDDWKIAGLSGHVSVRYPTNGERMKIFDKAGVDFLDTQIKLADGNATEQQDMTKKLLIQIMDDVGPWCEEVALVYKDEAITSFEKIATTMQLMAVQLKIASAVILGAQQFVDKKKKKSTKRSVSSTTG